MALTDDEIFRQIKKDTNTGFSMLVKRFSEPLYWHIRRITVSHHDAEDALQETLIRIFRSIDTLRDGASLKAWVYRIATNEAIRLVEKRRDTDLRLEDTLSDAHLAADDYAVPEDIEAVQLQRAIQTLPPKQQATFNLRYYDELDYDRIAEIMETTPSNAKTNYHLAKNKIVKYLNEHIQ